MATAQNITPTEPQLIPPGSAESATNGTNGKRGPGRPRKNPAPPTPVIPPGDDNDIQIFFATSTDDEWSRRMVYAWRYEPFNNKKGGNKPTSAGQFGSKFDFDDVLKTLGSGHYRFDVVENPPGGIWPDGTTKGKRVRQGFATIIHPDYPPNMPLGEWVDDPRNEAWKWAIPMLEEKYGSLDGEDDDEDDDELPMYAGQSPDQMLETIKKGVDMFRGENSSNANLAAQMLAVAEKSADSMRALLDPAKQFETMQKLMLMVSPKQDNTIVDILRDELKASREEMAAMRAEIRELNRPQPLLTQVEQLLPVVERLAPMFGFGKSSGRSSGTDWGEVTVSVAKELSPVLTSIVDRMGQPPQAQQPPQQFQPPPAAAPTGPHGSTPQPQANANPQTQQPPAPPLPPNVTPDQVRAEEQRLNQIVRKHGALFATVAPQMVDSYQHETGYDFRDWFCNRKGKEVWMTLRQDVELPERLVALTQMHPTLRQQLRPDAKLFQFMKEFLTEFGEEDVEPEPESGAAANAA
jgi:hypothetical protein